MKIREKWNDFLCYVFGHRWMILEYTFLDQHLKNYYFSPDITYSYCYRCNELSQINAINGDLTYTKRDKVYLDSLPWNGNKPFPDNHPFLEFCIQVYYSIYRACNWPKDFYRECKYFIQRGKRGYSNRDLWSFDCYLSEVIIGGLKRLKEIRSSGNCGVPSRLCHDSTGKEIRTVEEASKILEDAMDKIIRAFELQKSMFDDPRILTATEQVEVDEGMKTFIEYFNDLGD